MSGGGGLCPALTPYPALPPDRVNIEVIRSCWVDCPRPWSLHSKLRISYPLMPPTYGYWPSPLLPLIFRFYCCKKNAFGQGPPYHSPLSFLTSVFLWFRDEFFASLPDPFLFQRIRRMEIPFLPSVPSFLNAFVPPKVSSFERCLPSGSPNVSFRELFWPFSSLFTVSDFSDGVSTLSCPPPLPVKAVYEKRHFASPSLLHLPEGFFFRHEF